MAEQPAPNKIMEAVRMPVAMHDALTAAADRRGVGKSSVLREALALWLATNEAA